MKTGIHKHIYTVLPRGSPSSVAAAASVVAQQPTSGVAHPRSRPRSNSASLYTSSGPLLPLSFFDSSGSAPSPSSRLPQPPQTGPRISVEPKHQSSQHSNGANGNPNPFALGPSPPANPDAPSLPYSQFYNPYPTQLHNHHHQYQHYQSQFPPATSPHTAANAAGDREDHAGLVAPATCHTQDTPADAASSSSSTNRHGRHKRPRLRYQLDIGAYGIPKRCRTVPMHSTRPYLPSRFTSTGRGLHTPASPSWTSSLDDLSLSVQVGEDAYFIRDNALGVADGVGGWARSKQSNGEWDDLGLGERHNRLHNLSPSALFARRLMHYTAAEIVGSSPSPLPPLSVSAPSSYTLDAGIKKDARRGRHRSPEPRRTCARSVSPSPYTFSDEEIDLEMAPEIESEAEDLSSHLDNLSEGIDVLQILERAYERTVKAHVNPQTQEPLRTGSSTALVAVLDCRRVEDGSHSNTSESKTCPSSDMNLPSKVLHTNPSNPSPGPSLSLHSSVEPILKIAHIGDSMGMLIRDKEIVWRSDEMWWAFNTPVQLAPPAPRSRTDSPTPAERPQHQSAETTLSALSAKLASLSFGANDKNYQPFHPPPPPMPSLFPESSSQCAHIVNPPHTAAKHEFSESSSTHEDEDPDEVKVTPLTTAQLIELPVQADDILILASDGLSDNLWDEDILDEVLRFKQRGWAVAERTEPIRLATLKEEVELSFASGLSLDMSTTSSDAAAGSGICNTLKRCTFAGMLSEALCSRARRVSERTKAMGVDDEVPFGRRARESGKVFGSGGKRDDISVLVAVISPKRSPSPILPNFEVKN